MQAYAILDGGGVKGAALTGCLQAATDFGVEFQGYAGTSAGSLVALFAAIGYKPNEIRDIMTKELNLSEFLDDNGSDFEELKEFWKYLTSREVTLFNAPKLYRRYKKVSKVLQKMSDDFGLYSGKYLEEFLKQKICFRFPNLKEEPDITFFHLDQHKCMPIKILASDIATQSPAIFSSDDSQYGNSVIMAVRASTSYPFLFRPVTMHKKHLVDGGLSSNLPVFLFEHERRSNNLPVIAFDLVTERTDVDTEYYDLAAFCADMLNTSLEASEELLRENIKGLHHIIIPISRKIGTTDFGITPEDKENLYHRGYSHTSKYLTKHLPEWRQASDNKQRVQATYRTHPEVMKTVLSGVVKEVGNLSKATSLRSYVMLPTAWGTQIVSYNFGMDRDPDANLELSIDEGVARQVLKARRPTIVDLTERAQMNWTGVRRDRKAMLVAPVFDISEAQTSSSRSVSELRILGTLTIDTDMALAETEWIDLTTKSLNAILLEWIKGWSDVVGQLLS